MPGSIIEQIGGELSGPIPDDGIRGVGALEDAGPTDVAPYVDGRYSSHLARTRARVVLTDEAHARAVIAAGLTAWIHPDPPGALEALVDLFHPPLEPDVPALDPHRGIWISGGVRTGERVRLGSGCVVHEGVRIGDDVTVGEHTVIGQGVVVGDGSVLGAGSWVGEGTRLGRRVILGEGCVVGSPGFGLRHTPAGPVPTRHVGAVIIGDDVSIGPRSVVARGSLSDTRIGDGSRLDAHVQVGHNVRMGRCCVIAAQAGIAGSTVLGDGVWVGGQAGIADHVTVGDAARIAARSGVIGDVPAGETYEGYPAMPRYRWLRLVARLTRSEE